MISASVDAEAFAKMAVAMKRLPEELKVKAFRRAFSHTRAKVLTQVTRKVADYSGAPYRKVRAYTRADMTTRDAIAIIMRSPWLKVIELEGVRATKTKGVVTRRNGVYASAFIANMASKGVFSRKGAARHPVKELYGPNPAHSMGEDRHGEFQKLANDIMERDLAARIMHEVDFILSGIGR